MNADPEEGKELNVRRELRMREDYQLAGKMSHAYLEKLDMDIRWETANRLALRPHLLASDVQQLTIRTQRHRRTEYDVVSKPARSKIRQRQDET